VVGNKNTTELKKKVNIFTRMQHVDVRVIYTLIFILISISLLRPFGVPIYITDNTRNLYNVIDKLPPGSKVLIGSEMTSGLWAEYGCMSTVLFDHLFRKDIQIFITSFQYSSSLVLTRELVFPKIDNGNFYGKIYGVDWVDLGFIPGAETAMIKFGTNIMTTTSADYLGTPLDQLPVMKGVNKATDFNLVIVMGGSITIQYIRQFSGQWGLPVGSATSALNYPKWLPYVSTGQIIGILNGIRGGAEYEVLIGKIGLGFGAQNIDGLSLIYIMLFILIFLANVGYWSERFKEGKR